VIAPSCKVNTWNDDDSESSSFFFSQLPDLREDLLSACKKKSRKNPEKIQKTREKIQKNLKEWFLSCLRQKMVFKR
jgi:cytoplasmic iron level regulating protein YaaA (DUF328/UPF0246 family)